MDSPTFRHGHARASGNSPEYGSWTNMRRRCYAPKTPQFSGYGGRGITVCDEWRDSFDQFLHDMGLAPSRGHTLDRIDNDGPYSPENCRWATRKEQNNNRRDNHKIAYAGKVMTLAQWSDYLGIPCVTLRSRIWRGWPIERAFTRHVAKSRHGEQRPIPNIPQ